MTEKAGHRPPGERATARRPADATRDAEPVVEVEETAEPAVADPVRPDDPARTAAPAPPPAPARRRWSTAAKVATWTVTVLSAVTGVIAVVPILFRDASDFSNLYVEIHPFPATGTDWALPVGADHASFPAGSGDTCSDEQRAWLEQNATEITHRVMVDMRNTAREGPMLTIKDFMVVGERERTDARHVRVVCDTSPPSTVQVQGARLDATGASSVAMLSAAAWGATRQGLPDTPVAWNLAPGETGQLLIRISASAQVDGSLAATVMSGQESRQYVLDDTDVVLLPLVDDGLTYLRAGRSLACVTEVDGEPGSCDVIDVMGERP